MTSMVLARDPSRRDLWVLEGVGTLCRTGRVSRAATAEAGGLSWQLVRRGWARPGFRAADAAGVVVGELEGRLMKRGETVRWHDRELTLRPDGGRRHAHALRDGERRLVTMTPTGEGKRSLEVSVEDPATDPGLLLFMAFIVQAYSDDASFGATPPGI